MFRIPNLTDPKNEVVQYGGIAIAVLTWLVTWLSKADVSTTEGVIAAAAVLLTNLASSQVSSKKTTAELAA